MCNKAKFHFEPPQLFGYNGAYKRRNVAKYLLGLCANDARLCAYHYVYYFLIMSSVHKQANSNKRSLFHENSENVRCNHTFDQTNNLDDATKDYENGNSLQRKWKR